MSKTLSINAQKVQDSLQAKGMSLTVVELPVSTRTAEEAAQAIGCQVGQIVKSLIFKSKRKELPVLVLVSGKNRADERKIESLINEPLGKADANFVKETTGFTIGGVPPVGHLQKITTYIDQDLLSYSMVWAAAGTPNAVFQIPSKNLAELTEGLVADIKKIT